MKLDQMVLCCWHKPREAIVVLKTGAAIPREVLDRIPASREKSLMMESGGMCDPCAAGFVAGLKGRKPAEEGIMKGGQG
ncbi:MAG: hypothetical protein AB1529_03050 [Candidatus Micrarchaeota archaeon]